MCISTSDYWNANECGGTSGVLVLVKWRLAPWSLGCVESKRWFFKKQPWWIICVCVCVHMCGAIYGNNDYSKGWCVQRGPILLLKADVRRIARSKPMYSGAFTFARMNIVIASVIARVSPFWDYCLSLSFSLGAGRAFMAEKIVSHRGWNTARHYTASHFSRSAPRRSADFRPKIKSFALSRRRQLPHASLINDGHERVRAKAIGAAAEICHKHALLCALVTRIRGTDRGITIAARVALPPLADGNSTVHFLWRKWVFSSVVRKRKCEKKRETYDGKKIAL